MNRQQFLLSLIALPALAGISDDPDLEILTGKKSPVLRFGLQDSASKAFEAMKKEALKQKIKLHITSGYRDYEKQMAIWNGKFDRYSSKGIKGLELIRKITEFSAMPGTSRHHWGTDADILDIAVLQPKNPLEPNHYVAAKGVYNRMHDWMLHNADRFDFYEAYTDDPTRPGYKFEPWHFSYKPISAGYLKKYNKLVKVENIKLPELKGNNLITESFFADYKKKYINGINHYLS